MLKVKAVCAKMMASTTCPSSLTRTGTMSCSWLKSTRSKILGRDIARRPAKSKGAARARRAWVGKREIRVGTSLKGYARAQLL